MAGRIIVITYLTGVLRPDIQDHVPSGRRVHAVIARLVWATEFSSILVIGNLLVGN